MTQMSKDSYGDGNVYRGQRSKDSVVKTITLAQPEHEFVRGECVKCGASIERQEPVTHTLNCVCGAVWDIKTDGSEEMVHTPYRMTDEGIKKLLEFYYRFGFTKASEIPNKIRGQDYTVCITDGLEDTSKPHTEIAPRTWVNLTDEEVEEIERWVEFKEEGSGRIPMGKLVSYISEKLRNKNT